jgi:thiol-disulfide isomerase/thioredoxin
MKRNAADGLFTKPSTVIRLLQEEIPNMKRLHTALWLFITVFMLFQSTSLSAEENKPLPWSVLPRVAQLGENQQAAFLDVLKSEQNYGGCRESVYDCLTITKPDRTAVRIANFGAYLVAKGVPPRSLGRLVSERANFAGLETISTFNYEETPSMGNPEAKITVTEFAEFKCPYCLSLSPLLKRLVEESNGNVRFFFKHFPLKSHQGSALASQAAQAAHRQEKFWEMYDRLFSDMNRHGMEDLIRHASELGLDVEKFKSDLEDPALISIIERDKMEGIGANVTGVPTLFINGKNYYFRHDEAFLKDMINEEAERLGITPPYKEWRYQ